MLFFCVTRYDDDGALYDVEEYLGHVVKFHSWYDGYGVHPADAVYREVLVANENGQEWIPLYGPGSGLIEIVCPD